MRRPRGSAGRALGVSRAGPDPARPRHARGSGGRRVRRGTACSPRTTARGSSGAPCARRMCTRCCCSSTWRCAWSEAPGVRAPARGTRARAGGDDRAIPRTPATRPPGRPPGESPVATKRSPPEPRRRSSPPAPSPSAFANARRSRRCARATTGAVRAAARETRRAIRALVPREAASGHSAGSCGRKRSDPIRAKRRVPPSAARGRRGRLRARKPRERANAPKAPVGFFAPPKAPVRLRPIERSRTSREKNRKKKRRRGTFGERGTRTSSGGEPSPPSPSATAGCCRFRCASCPATTGTAGFACSASTRARASSGTCCGRASTPGSAGTARSGFGRSRRASGGVRGVSPRSTFGRGRSSRSCDDAYEVVLRVLLVL